MTIAFAIYLSTRTINHPSLQLSLYMCIFIYHLLPIVYRMENRLFIRNEMAAVVVEL